ncbi:hypothetical protein DdX_16216 [Ditylenchus destructor]|uniref:Uncharacterized protein n=1 Tax=Ditylenchus destructor TaxID=166010 RepID=A0AAD4QU66_9BILA|nr:hypothetical protein DdX_16216 [Ditylenchus destructor]
MLMEEAGEIFDDEQDFPVPPDPNPPVTDKVKLRTFQSLVTRLDISHDESERVMLGLRNCLSNLHDIRVKMTEKERTADNVIYDDFVDNNDYVGPMKQLAKYCKKLKLQKRALLDKIEELEDSLAAAATPAIPRRSGVAVSLPNPVPDPTHVEPSLHSPELPKFDGDISNWLTFWSHFKYLVHDSKRLPPALKLKFLIDSCKGGPAQNLVDVFELKDEYYPLALSRLKERFNNTEEVKDALDHKLTVLAPTDGSLDDLSRFIDELENIFMRMEALGHDSKEDALTCLELMKKKVATVSRKAGKKQRKPIIIDAGVFEINLDSLNIISS